MFQEPLRGKWDTPLYPEFPSPALVGMWNAAQGTGVEWGGVSTGERGEEPCGSHTLFHSKSFSRYLALWA